VGPGEALLVVDAPRILRALHAAEGVLKLRGALAFDHDLVAADGDGVGHLFVLCGAGLHAGSARCAAPGGFGRERELEKGVGAWGSLFEWRGSEGQEALSRGEIV